jgi:AcrR family transcriptional regulator
MTRKQDRRVQRTQQLLRTAMLSLIQEKGFETVSVQEIVDRANVGRATFYAHFDSKADLLASGFDGLRASLKELQQKARLSEQKANEPVLGFSHKVFAHANEYRDVFRAMVGKRSGAVVQQFLRKILLELVGDEVKAISSRSAVSSVYIEALAQFIAGALLSVLVWWITAKTRLSAEQVNNVFRQVAIPALKAGTEPELRQRSQT